MSLQKRSRSIGRYYPSNDDDDDDYYSDRDRDRDYVYSSRPRSEYYKDRTITRYDSYDAPPSYHSHSHSHRGRRSHRDLYPEDDIYVYEEHEEAAPRARSKSRARKALDKLGAAIGIRGKSQLRKRSFSRSLSRSRSRSRDGRSAYEESVDEEFISPGARGRSVVSRRRSTLTKNHYISPSPPPCRSTSRGFFRRRSRSRARSVAEGDPWKQRVLAGVDAAVIEAIRLRKEPGEWTGRKGARLATAALAAAAVDTAVDREGTGGRGRRIGSAVAGLVVNRVVNGPRSNLRRY